MLRERNTTSRVFFTIVRGVGGDDDPDLPSRTTGVRTVDGRRRWSGRRGRGPHRGAEYLQRFCAAMGSVVAGARPSDAKRLDERRGRRPPRARVHRRRRRRPFGAHEQFVPVERPTAVRSVTTTTATTTCSCSRSAAVAARPVVVVVFARVHRQHGDVTVRAAAAAAAVRATEPAERLDRGVPTDRRPALVNVHGVETRAFREHVGHGPGASGGVQPPEVFSSELAAHTLNQGVVVRRWRLLPRRRRRLLRWPLLPRWRRWRLVLRWRRLLR